MKPHLEFIYTTADGKYAYKTSDDGMIFQGDTYAATLSLWNAAQRFAMDARMLKGQPCMMLDFYNSRGDIKNTIFLSLQGYQDLTGKKALTRAEYKALDKRYWARVNAEVIERRRKELSKLSKSPSRKRKPT